MHWQAGADATLSAHSSDTALHRSAGTNRIGALQELLAVLPRAAVDAQDKLGQTAMHVAALEQHEEVCVLLAEADASVDIKKTQRHTAPLLWKVSCLTLLHCSRRRSF